jgi:hypothetical protein
LSTVFASEIAGHSLALYVDDAILCHSTFSGHLEQLRHIFQKLRTHNLRINPKKSTFARESVTFLGFVFSAVGTSIDSQRFQKIRNIQAPKNITETRQICGLFQYFKRFLPNFAKTLSPIRQLLQKDVPFCWTAEQGSTRPFIKVTTTRRTAQTASQSHGQDSYAAMHNNETPASGIAFIPRETDFRLTDHARGCRTNCTRQCRPHAMVQGHPQSITPLSTETRLKPYNATAHGNEQTFITPHWTASDLTTDEPKDYKSPHTDGHPISASTHEQPLVAAETTATPLRNDHDIKSAIADHSGTDDSSALMQDECHTNAARMISYKALSLAPSGEVYNANVIKVSARKLAKPQPLYKAHFLHDNLAQWLPASQIPPAVLAKFFVQQYVQSQTRKLKLRGISQQRKNVSKARASV